jgi:phosphatidylserine decarboxylase
MIRTRPFFFAYRFFPHGAINAAAMHAAKVRRPRWLVKRAIDMWIQKDGIDMKDFVAGDFATLEEFFLRRLKDGARPLGNGIVAPVDGCVVGRGRIGARTILQVKGRPIGVERLVNGLRHDLDVRAYEGGTYVTLFLRPRGYHFVHAPFDGEIVDVRWIPGRYFPQNEDALQHIDGIYERNERAVLRVRTDAGEALLVMVGASVIGGIHVNGIASLKQRDPIPLNRRIKKGDELGHFSFGSTVVMLLPPAMSGEIAKPIGGVGAPPTHSIGEEVPMGTSLLP